MASRSSSGKKNDTSLRIKISTKKDKKQEEVIESCESGEEEEEDEDEDEEILPSKSRRGNCSFNKSAFSMPDDISKLMNRVLCCSCGKQINPMNPGAVRRHPWLKVVTCKKCYKFLKSGPFTRDSEGTDEQCRWCGDGGRLYGCDYCSHCFCRSCIKRNLGRSEAAHMENEDNSKWKCYLCKPKKIRQLVEDCSKILNYIEKEEKKEREREERAKQREKDKLQKMKEERAKKQLEVSKDKEANREKESTPQRSTRASLPAPKIKQELKSRESTPLGDRFAKGKRDSPVVIDDDSPAKPNKIRMGTYSNPAPGQGVHGVKKLDNGTFAVTVGPRPIRPVIAYAATSVPIMPKQGTSLINPLKIQPNPLTSSIIRDALSGNQARVPQVTVDKRTGKMLPLPNNLKDAYDSIYPHNVDSTVEKMATVAQSLTLYLNSVKTDLAIAKLSQPNPFNARNLACNTLKKGLDIFFNGLKEILNVQFKASSPTIDLSDLKANTSTPKADKIVKKENLDVSTIPICLDDSDVGDHKESTPKKEDSKNKKNKSESNDESCMIVSDSEDKNQVVMEVDGEDGEKIKVQKVSDSADEMETSAQDEAESEKEKSVEKETKEDNDVRATRKKGKGASKADDTDPKGKKANEKDENVAGDKTNDSENTAAELELLKEMADELNEMNENSSPEKAGKGLKDSKGKVSVKSGKKGGQEETDSDLNTKSDSKDSNKSGNTDNDDDDKAQNSSRPLRRTRSKVMEPDDEASLDEKAKPGSKSKGKNEDTEKVGKNAKAKKDLKSGSEDESAKNDTKKKQGDDSKKKQGDDTKKKQADDTKKKEEKTSKSGKDMKSESEDESAENDTKKKRGDDTKKKQGDDTKKKQEKTSKAGKDLKSESEDESAENDTKKKRGDDTKKKQGDDTKKKQEKTSKAGKDLKSESEDESAENDTKKKQGDDTKKKQGDDTKKKQGKTSKASKTSEKTTDNVDEKSKDKKSTSKVAKKSSDKEDESLDPEKLETGEKEDDLKLSADESDDSDSDNSSGEDEPKKKRRAKKGKASENKKSEKSPKKTSKKGDGQDTESSSKAEKKKSTKTSKKKSSEEEEDPGSDSSNYDPDLEKEIKSLAKDTKMRPRRTCVKETEEKTTTKDNKSKDDKASKKDKASKDDKKGQSSKGKKGQSDDLSSDENDDDVEQETEEEEKPKRKGKRSAKSQGSSPESDLEEEDKPKQRKSARSRKNESSQDSDPDSEDNKKGKKGKKAASKGKKNILEDISSDDEEPDEADDDEPDIDEEDDDDTDVSSSSLKNISSKRKSVIEDSEDNSDDFMEEEGSCDTSDPEVSFPKLGSPKKGKSKEKPGKKGKKGTKLDIEEELSEDSDFVTAKNKKKKKIRDKLLDAKVSDSDSDVGKKGKGKGKGAKKRKRKAETEEDDEEEEEDGEESEGKKKKGKGKGKRRKRIKKLSSSDDEKEPGAEDDLDSGDEEDEDGPGGFLKRKKIRKVQTNKKLKDATKAARKAEEARRKRIEDRQKEYNTFVEVEGGESEGELPEGTERHKEEDTSSSAIAKILGSPKKIPITTKCVLELDKDKKPLIEVDKTLIRKLKPHQVEAVRFMYNCCVESLERMHKGQEAGCILAHCMGLGKTLSCISFVHTMLRNVKLTKMTKCLVVCPLNTVLNWVNEFEIWLADVDYEIEVFEMSKVKANFERAQMLKEWHESGAAVLILGYDMYRNLVQGSHCKNKKQKKTFYETLADPGPDIVICDEGHILKNDQTSLSKSMSKIKAQKRIVLTGTPLQNNLGEYHCMVNFVKPSLLGTRKEFANRFVNPITNGQCRDSTPADVKLMKRRAHILHEHLAGCVQRKDYSALTKFLPPKLEYVISVRLAKTQMDLYEKYLELSQGGEGEAMGKGARLFKDYQALMRIWTHPWVLKLDEIRQENKRMYDDSEDSFIDDESDGEDSFIDNSTSSSDSDSDPKRKKKKKGGGSGSSSSEDEKKNGDANENEVVKKWTSRRRGNEEGAGSSWMEDMGYAPEGPKEVSSEWWAEYVKEEDEFKLEQSGKLMLLFQILKMCEDIGDKVLVFSQSLLSLDIIEDFLQKIDEANNPTTEEKKEGEDGKKEGEDGKKEEEDGKKEDKEKKPEVNGDVNGSGDKAEEPKEEDPLAQYGKSWTKGADYFRMDGSTNSQNRKASQDRFNDPENYRARLFLISTKAGSLGINLVAANRVIIFDASWNPSHDIQSIFRVYRFGQVKPVYVYRFLAQGTMEEKIYERQVTKQSLSQRVVDEHQIERHFTASDLQELYKFSPDRLDDPDRKEQPLPMLPKDHMLAELMSSQKQWIVTFHEHDSLLENKIEQELSEEEKKAAWEDYEEEKKGRPMMMMYQGQGMYNQQGPMQGLQAQAQPNIDPQVVMQIVQDLKARYPNLPPEIFQQRVQAVLRQVLTTQVMQQTELQRRMLNQQKANELNRLNQIKQQIQQQQAMVNNQQQVLGMSGFSSMSQFGMPGASGMSAFGSAPRTALAQQLMGMNQTMKNLQSKPSGSSAGQDKRS